jgi:RNA recognition motif-containing protein
MQSPNNSRLFAANLPFALTEDELKMLFQNCGHVQSVKIIIDRDTGKSRGFGFVEMGSPDEADKAIETFDQYGLSGRRIEVREAEERPVRITR